MTDNTTPLTIIQRFDCAAHRAVLDRFWRTPEPAVRECRVCGETFKPKSHRVRICSAACYSRAYRARIAEELARVEEHAA